MAGFCKTAIHRGHTQAYLQSRAVALAEECFQKERQLLTKPTAYFNIKKLRDITVEDLLDFRQWRVDSGVGPTIINMEMGVVRRFLKRAKRWSAFEDDVRPPQRTSDPHSPLQRKSDCSKLPILTRSGKMRGWIKLPEGVELSQRSSQQGCLSGTVLFDRKRRGMQ